MDIQCWVVPCLQVQYNDEQVVITPERAMSMIMKAMQKIAQDDQGSPVTDVVLAVPAYFTDAERHAMLDAATIAGLNCLRLMNDTTAGIVCLATMCNVCVEAHKPKVSHRPCLQRHSRMGSTKPTCLRTRRRMSLSWMWAQWTLL